MQRGSPIRTPSDHRPFTNSPRLIAGHHVLHRLLIPRHPPCALTHSPHLKRAANQITHNNKQSRRSFIRCSRPLFTNKNNNKKEPHNSACSPTTQQRVYPPAACPIQRAHNTRTQHTTTMHHESFCDVPPKNKHHTQRMVYPPKPGGCSLERR